MNELIYVDTDAAVFILGWSSPSQLYEIVPPYRLFPSVQPIMGSPYTVSPTSIKPTIVNNVSLIITSWDSMRVTFRPPTDDGGSAIVGYGVEWFSAHDPYGVLEIKTIKISNLVTGGTFTINYNGLQYWYPVAFDVTSVAMENILEKLPGIGRVTVNTGIDSNSTSWIITFVSNLEVGQGWSVNNGISSLGIDASGLVSSFSSAIPLAIVCQDGVVVYSSVLDCFLGDSISATASLVNGSHSGSANYPAVVDLVVGSQPYFTYDIPMLIQSSASIEGFSVRVYAINQAGFVSLPTIPVTVKPMASPDVPAYSEVIKIAGVDSAVNVYWTAVLFPEDRASPVLTFQIQWSPDQSFTSPDSYTGPMAEFPSSRVPMGPRLVLQYTIRGLSPGKQYFVRICSINAVGMSC
jgi:hypothetical protein